MNDLDTQLLRRALHAPQEPGYPAPGRTEPADLAEIITRGRRLRWRRRAMAAGGSVCLAAALVGAVAGIGRLTTPSSGPAQHVVSPVVPARTTPAPSPSPGRGRATPSPAPSATAVPTAIPTAVPTATAIPTAVPTATAIPTAVPTATAIPTATAMPTPTLSAGAASSATSEYSATEYSATSTPSASAAGTDGEQPSPTAIPSA
jgi:hypothetical protein